MRRKVHPWMRIKRMAKFPDGFIKIWTVKWRAGVVHWPPACWVQHTFSQFNKHFSRAINNGKWTIRAGHSDISPVGIFSVGDIKSIQVVAAWWVVSRGARGGLRVCNELSRIWALTLVIFSTLSSTHSHYTQLSTQLHGWIFRTPNKRYTPIIKLSRLFIEKF